MTGKPVLKPGPGHPITITPTTERIVVLVAGRVVADTRRALVLREATYPPVHYLPLEDTDPALLEPSTTTSYCPYKGEASYYSIPVGGPGSVDAIWVYRQPHEAVAAISNHVAFYPDRVDAIEVTD